MKDIEIQPSDLIITTFSNPPKSQWSSRMDSGVRVHHIPTGLQAECNEERHPHRNKARALEQLQKLVNEQAVMRIPAVGSIWKHKGNVYTVKGIANEHTTDHSKYPVAVMYVGENGNLWSRPLATWYTSMTASPEGEEPSDGDVFRALIQYILKCDEPLPFLRCWNEGDWKGCREWEDAPEILFPKEKP